jgi:hypothetical protein
VCRSRAVSDVLRLGVVVGEAVEVRFDSVGPLERGVLRRAGVRHVARLVLPRLGRERQQRLLLHLVASVVLGLQRERITFSRRSSRHLSVFFEWLSGMFSGVLMNLLGIQPTHLHVSSAYSQNSLTTICNLLR